MVWPPETSATRASPAAGAGNSAEKLNGGPPRRTVESFCTGRPAVLTVMAPSRACSLTTMSRKGEPADGFSGDHQMRTSGDS